MKKIELVYREILESASRKQFKITQADLAKGLRISLSTVNHALKPLISMNSISVGQRSLEILDSKKILYYWASIRNLGKATIYMTRADKPVKKIEAEMPPVEFTAYTAYKFIFKDVPADYSEVYVYAEAQSFEEIKKRFPPSKKIPNLFVLKKDFEGKITLPQLFVDLWQLKEWYAKDFLIELERKLGEKLNIG